MKSSVWVTTLGSEFDDFLFAPITEESSGTMLSVISALARLDLDPWQEAKNLAVLPGETATKRLASLLMAALPEGPSARRDPETIAARLTALLPRHANPKNVRLTTLLGADDAMLFRSGISMCVVFLVFMLVAQLVVATRQPPASLGDAPVQTAGTVSPQLPSLNTGQ